MTNAIKLLTNVNLMIKYLIVQVSIPWFCDDFNATSFFLHLSASSIPNKFFGLI